MHLEVFCATSIINQRTDKLSSKATKTRPLSKCCTDRVKRTVPRSCGDKNHANNAIKRKQIAIDMECNPNQRKSEAEREMDSQTAQKV